MEEAYTVSTIRGHVRQRKNEEPPVAISMVSSCPQNSGNATITIKNISNSSISGKLHFLVKERHVDIPWGGMDESECVNRGMIPGVNGESVTIAAGETLTKERSFTIDSKWEKDNCRLVAFLQKSNKEIVQGCRIKVDEGTPIVTSKNVKQNTISFKHSGRLLKISSHFQGEHKISIIDLQGRLLKQISLANVGQWFQIPDAISAGTYIVKIDVTNTAFTQKVIISK